MVRRRVA
jgi:hypothetical protein